MQPLTRLIIMRHGNTFAAGDVVTRVGVTDLPLVASGLAQAEAAGRYLLEQGLVPDCVYTSTLQRTMRTGAVVAETMGLHLPQQPLSFFDEIDYGVDENQPESTVRARIGEAALQRWEEEAVPPPGWQVDVDRIIAGWHHFVQDVVLQQHCQQTVLVVTSNGIARFAGHITGDMQQFRRDHAPIKMATGAISLFTHHTNQPQWRCEFWNHRL